MSDHRLVLYHYWRSSSSWRLRWALALKGIPFESRTVNLLEGEQRGAEYLKINPSGTVPCLLIDGKSFGESVPLLEWLEERYPGTPLLPQDPLQRLLVRELVQVVNAGIQPLQNLAVLKHLSSEPQVKKEWAQHWIRQGLHVFSAKVAKGAEGRFCVGDQVTLADLALIPQCYNAQRFEVDLGAYPRLEAIYRRCLATTACDTAAPHRQPDYKADA